MIDRKFDFFMKNDTIEDFINEHSLRNQLLNFNNESNTSYSMVSSRRFTDFSSINNFSPGTKMKPFFQATTSSPKRKESVIDYLKRYLILYNFFLLKNKNLYILYFPRLSNSNSETINSKEKKQSNFKNVDDDNHIESNLIESNSRNSIKSNDNDEKKKKITNDIEFNKFN